MVDKRHAHPESERKSFNIRNTPKSILNFLERNSDIVIIEVNFKVGKDKEMIIYF